MYTIYPEPETTCMDPLGRMSVQFESVRPLTLEVSFAGIPQAPCGLGFRV